VFSFDIVVSDASTVVTVAGDWDDYTVLGTNTAVGTAATVTSGALGATGFGVLYSAATGKTTQVGG